MSNVTINFAKYPELHERLRNPVVAAEFSTTSFLSRFSKLLGAVEDGGLYRIIFREGAPRTLMNLTSGEQAGLSAAVSVDHNGKIHSLVALKSVDDSVYSLLPAILNLGFYGAISAQLSCITGLLNSVLQQQNDKDQAKFERISETIIDCAEAIPLMADDKDLRQIQLQRIIGAGDECLELLSYFRRNFQTVVAEWRIDQYRGSWSPGASYFRAKIVGHSIFAVFERLVAARICAILISGDYSLNCINYHSQFIKKQIFKIRSLLDFPLLQLDRVTQDWKDSMLEHGLSDYELGGMRQELAKHEKFVLDARSQLNKQLEDLLQSFDILSSLSEQKEIELYLVDGMLVIDAPASDMKGSQATIDASIEH